MNKKVVIIGVVGAALLSFSCQGGKVKSDATGVFEATEVVVSSESAGKLLEWNADEGKLVQQGEVLGYIDTIQLDLKRRQLKAASKSSAARLQNVKIQIAALEEQITTQQRELARVDELLKSGAATQKQRDDAQSQLEITRRQRDAQLQQLGNSNESVTSDLDNWQIQIAQIDDQIRRCYITSPIQGRILLKYAERGELCTAGKALFKVADTENLYLRAYLPAPLLTTIKLGQKATVYADQGDSSSKSYEGVVTWISDKAEFTPKTIQTRDERANLVYAVKIKVVNDGLIKIGMYGEVKF